MSHRVPRALFIALSCAVALLPSCVWAQNAQRSASSQQGLYLVFPFENNGSSPRLDWLGEGLEELTIQYLSDAGEQVYSHTGRASELERYGLPTSAKLSRATMLSSNRSTGEMESTAAIGKASSTRAKSNFMACVQWAS